MTESKPELTLAQCIAAEIIAQNNLEQLETEIIQHDDIGSLMVDVITELQQSNACTKTNLHALFDICTEYRSSGLLPLAAAILDPLVRMSNLIPVIVDSELLYWNVIEHCSEKELNLFHRQMRSIDHHLGSSALQELGSQMSMTHKLYAVVINLETQKPRWVTRIDSSHINPNCSDQTCIDPTHIDSSDSSELPELHPLPIPAIQQLLDQSDLEINISEDSDQARTKVASVYSILPYASQQAMAGLNNVMDDTEHFHRYGPLCCKKDITDSPIECTKYGGCRMLLCNEYHPPTDTGYSDEENMVYTDDPWEDLYWFTGKCAVCDTVIVREQYAVRLAQQDGGWSGCYCSFDCVNAVQMTKIEKEINALIQQQLLKIKIEV